MLHLVGLCFARSEEKDHNTFKWQTVTITLGFKCLLKTPYYPNKNHPAPQLRKH